MILDEKLIEYFKSIAQDHFTLLIEEDYGSVGIEKLTFLTDTITKIYKYLDFLSFTKVVIYIPLDQTQSLDNIQNSNTILIQSFQSLAQIHGTELIIEVKENLDLMISVDLLPSVDSLRNNAIIYERQQTVETILGKTRQKALRQLPYAESYFSVEAYKELEVALEEYKGKFARYSEGCAHLATVWFDPNRIFFNPRPEQVMRNSLTYFLKARLRNVEVRPEQVVDETHPVDIKITWEYTNKLALIEIKWLGKSLRQWGEDFRQTYTGSRAAEGAKQLADYLDSNKIQAPAKVTKGYLVVFDGRRWRTNSNTQEVSASQGLHYENDEIVYTPDYHQVRTDFAKPIRFFMEPKCIN